MCKSVTVCCVLCVSVCRARCRMGKEKKNFNEVANIKKSYKKRKNRASEESGEEKKIRTKIEWIIKSTSFRNYLTPHVDVCWIFSSLSLLFLHQNNFLATSPNAEDFDQSFHFKYVPSLRNEWANETWILKQLELENKKSNILWYVCSSQQ